MTSGKAKNSLFRAFRAAKPAPTTPKEVIDPKAHDADIVPFGLRVTGAYAWRLVALAAAAAVVIWLITQLKLIVLPVIVAVLLTALVWPAFSAMLRHRVPKWLACVITVLGTIVVVTAMIWLVAWQISQEWSTVVGRGRETIDSAKEYLRTGPLHLSDQQIDGYLDQGVSFVLGQADQLAQSALSIGATVGHFGAGSVLAMFIWICFLADGKKVWKWTVRLFPKRAREATNVAGHNGWRTLVNYARTQIVVATIDAVGIGVGAFLLGVPLAIPIALSVFLGAFVPLVGAIVTGFIAVGIALLYNGIWIAVAMLAVVLIVQQVESHVLQPIIMGSAVNVHPVAVVIVVAAGSMVAGIAGALLAVPTAAFVNVVVNTIASGRWRNGPDVPDKRRGGKKVLKTANE